MNKEKETTFFLLRKERLANNSSAPQFYVEVITAFQKFNVTDL